MANIRSAAKRIRVTQRQTRVNGHRRSRMRTMVKRARIAIDAKDQTALASVQTAARELQRAVRKGILHKNTAARRQSHLARLLKTAGIKHR